MDLGGARSVASSIVPQRGGGQCDVPFFAVVVVITFFFTGKGGTFEGSPRRNSSGQRRLDPAGYKQTAAVARSRPLTRLAASLSNGGARFAFGTPAHWLAKPSSRFSFSPHVFFPVSRSPSLFGTVFSTCGFSGCGAPAPSDVPIAERDPSLDGRREASLPAASFPHRTRRKPARRYR
ncbi:hypothetical protein MRX96_054866 [Rhipicephalus microplus]